MFGGGDLLPGGCVGLEKLVDSCVGAVEIVVEACFGGLEFLDEGFEFGVFGSEGLVEGCLSVDFCLETRNIGVTLDNLLLIVGNTSVELSNRSIGSIKLLLKIALLLTNSLELILRILQNLARFIILDLILLDKLSQLSDFISEGFRFLVGLVELLLKLFNLGFCGAAVTGEVFDRFLEVGDFRVFGFDFFELGMVVGVKSGEVL